MKNEKSLEKEFGKDEKDGKDGGEGFGFGLPSQNLVRRDSFGQSHPNRNYNKLESFGAPFSRRDNRDLSFKGDNQNEVASPVFGGFNGSQPSFSNFGGGNISAISGKSSTVFRGLEESKDHTGEKSTPQMGQASANDVDASSIMQKNIIVINKIQRREEPMGPPRRTGSVKHTRSDLNSTPVIISRNTKGPKQ